MPACSDGEPGSRLRHEGAAVRVELERLRETGRHVLNGDTDAAALHVAVLEQLRNDLTDHVARNGEADADVAAGAGQDRGADAEQLAVDVDERAARVAGIDRRIRLNEVLVAFDVDAVAAERAHDARRRRLPEPERIADGDDVVADSELAGITYRQLGEVCVVGRDTEQSHVGAGVAADQHRVVLMAVAERDDDAVGVLNHVMVRDDEAFIGIDDDAGADALPRHPRGRQRCVGTFEEAAK